MPETLNNNDDRDRRVLELYEKVLEIEQRLIPTGLHIFGQSPDDAELGDLLRMVASFDRPELGVRSLPDLVADHHHRRTRAGRRVRSACDRGRR